MTGIMNNIIGAAAAQNGPAGGAGAGFDKIISQIASGISDSMNGGQGAKAQGDSMSKLENILGKLEELLAGLKGDEGAGEGAEGADNSAGCDHSGKGEETGAADGSEAGGEAEGSGEAEGAGESSEAENSDPIEQLKELIKQLQDNGMLSKKQAEKLMTQLDKMQAKQEAPGQEGAGEVGGAEKAEGAEATDGGQAAEEAKAGEKAGEENSIVQQLEDLIAQLKEKLGGAEAKEGGESSGCAEAEHAGKFMDKQGEADYQNMVEENKAA